MRMTNRIPFKSKLTPATGGLRCYIPKGIVEAYKLKAGMFVRGEIEVVKK